MGEIAGWTIAVFLITGVCVVLQIRGGIISYLGALLLAYAFLQISSYFYLVPFYKDGGNGYLLLDFVPWMIMAVLANLMVAVGLAVIRRLRR